MNYSYADGFTDPSNPLPPSSSLFEPAHRKGTKLLVCDISVPYNELQALRECYDPPPHPTPTIPYLERLLSP